MSAPLTGLPRFRTGLNRMASPVNGATQINRMRFALPAVNGGPIRQSPVNGARITFNIRSLRCGLLSLAYASGWCVFVFCHCFHPRVLAQPLQAAMHEHANVPFFAVDDRGDLAVVETIGPEVEGFALIGRQFLDQRSKQT